MHLQYLRGSSGIARMLRRRQRGLECPTVMSPRGAAPNLRDPRKACGHLTQPGHQLE